MLKMTFSLPLLFFNTFLGGMIEHNCYNLRFLGCNKCNLPFS